MATLRSLELIGSVLDSTRVSTGCTTARLSSIPEAKETRPVYV